MNISQNTDPHDSNKLYLGYIICKIQIKVEWQFYFPLNERLELRFNDPLSLKCLFSDLVCCKMFAPDSWINGSKRRALDFIMIASVHLVPLYYYLYFNRLCTLSIWERFLSMLVKFGFESFVYFHFFKISDVIFKKATGFIFAAKICFKKWMLTKKHY